MLFQVENRLFRVHKHLLAEDYSVFSSTFSLPHGASADSTTAIESSSDGNPIFLPSVTELEFETLLRYFYDG
ncbi:hypothetical protein BC826DRAFT_1017072 [Russula brevipes]|nr:hypothetical protein BC826DRAFT_1017072 [Russula brevipes]